MQGRTRTSLAVSSPRYASRRRTLTRLLACAPGAAVAALAAWAAAGVPAQAGEATPEPPNIIVIMTDDETVLEASERYMPITNRLIRRPGTDFTESIVSSPLCCPSRAGFLTGQYAHNNGVFDNMPGYPALRDKDSTVFTWLRTAGYRTGHVGRFLLNYTEGDTAPGGPPPGSAPPPPPGVESWFGYAGGPARYFHASFSEDGSPFALGTKPADYTTAAINSAAREFVRAARADPRPFFLWVAHIAPHSTNFNPRGSCGGGVPLPEAGALGEWRREPLPKPPSFNERRIEDKPSWVNHRSPLNAARRAALERSWRCALGTLSTVDQGVAGIFRELSRQGDLDDTVVIFTSDNGYHHGEHRIFLQKGFPYEEVLRVPLFIRVPPRYLGGGRDPARVGVPVNNLDLTATILHLAGTPPCNAAGKCSVLDGRSLLPVLRGRRSQFPRQRDLLVELGNRDCGNPNQPGIHNFYDAIRTRRHLYVELNHVDRETGACDRPEYELYDLERDPFQLANRARDPAKRPPSAVQADLAARLATLRRCAGIEGRDPVTLGDDLAERPFCR